MPDLAPFEAQRRETAGGIGAGIDTDSVTTMLDLVGHRVTVYDGLLQPRPMIQERVADPAQVGSSLSIQRGIGTNPRMHEGIVADHDHIFEPVEEAPMIRGDEVGKAVDEFLIVEAFIFRGLHAVAQNGFPTADPAEQTKSLGFAVECAEENLLVIAEQEPHRTALLRERPETFDDCSGRRAPVDDIAQEYQRRFCRPAVAVVCFDERDESVEQVGASVDIADGVDALTFGNGGQSRLGDTT